MQSMKPLAQHKLGLPADQGLQDLTQKWWSPSQTQKMVPAEGLPPAPGVLSIEKGADACNTMQHHCTGSFLELTLHPPECHCCWAGISMYSSGWVLDWQSCGVTGSMCPEVDSLSLAKTRLRISSL